MEPVSWLGEREKPPCPATHPIFGGRVSIGKGRARRGPTEEEAGRCGWQLPSPGLCEAVIVAFCKLDRA